MDDPKKTDERETSRPAWIALITGRLVIDRMSWLLTFGLAFCYSLGFLAMVLQLISFVLEGVPGKLVIALDHSGIQVLLQALGIAPDAAHRRDAYLVDLIAVFLALTLVIYWMTRRSVRDARGLYRALRSRSFPGKLSTWLHVSSPPWLSPQVIDAPSPTSVLDLLQEHSSNTEAWTRDLAAYLEQSDKVAPPQISMRICITDRVYVSIIDRDGKQERVLIEPGKGAELIAYLAVQGRGEWVTRKKMLEDIKDEHVNKHVSRLNQLIKTVAIEAGMHPEDEELPEKAEALRLVEYDETERAHKWRLASAVQVDVYPELVAVYDQINAAKDDSAIAAPSREWLAVACNRAMESYGDGWCGYYQDRYHIWPWTKNSYITYRDKCLAILEYAAEQEWEYILKHKHQPELIHDALQQVSILFAWGKKVALGIFPHVVYAQKVTSACIRAYRFLGYRELARRMYQDYVDTMMELDAKWSPPSDVLGSWPEATSPEEPGQKRRER